jgi:hypothetical protein
MKRYLSPQLTYLLVVIIQFFSLTIHPALSTILIVIYVIFFLVNNIFLIFNHMEEGDRNFLTPLSYSILALIGKAKKVKNDRNLPLYALRASHEIYFYRKGLFYLKLIDYYNINNFTEDKKEAMIGKILDNITEDKKNQKIFNQI